MNLGANGPEQRAESALSAIEPKMDLDKIRRVEIFERRAVQETTRFGDEEIVGWEVDQSGVRRTQ